MYIWGMIPRNSTVLAEAVPIALASTGLAKEADSKHAVQFIGLLLHFWLFCFQKDEIENCRVNGSLQFLVLKKLNRLAHIRCKKVRDETNEVNLNLKLNSIIQHKVKSSQ